MLFVILVGLLTFSNSVQGNAPLSETIKKVANIMESNLVGLLDSVSGISALNRSYQMFVRGRQSSIKCVIVDGASLIDEMATKLDEILARKVVALRKLKVKAEETVKEFKYEPVFKKNNVSFVNMKNFDENDQSLEYSVRFKQKVNFSASGVHIPLEIYEGYSEIQNGLRWSASLDEVFKKNYEDNPEFGWQIFGSEAGYMRVYPANKWKDIPEVPDLYDVRRRPWYIQGSTSPKDMLILMDISGSVHGQTFTLMKIAVRTLLNTLEENDYVNVAWFNNAVGWVTPGFKTFVQANSWNKKVLLEGIDNLSDGNMSSYSVALEFAFKEFQKFNETKDDNVGAECHQVIMMFTDGGTDKPEEIIKKYNSNKNIRIFTYAIGPHAVPVHTIKWIACNNKGHFYSISTVGGIRTIIQEYPNVLVRPMALGNSQSETWSTVYTDAGNLGMVITVTLPVFNRSKDGNQSSLGVVGIDTRVRDIRLLTPYRKIGPIGYPFIINLNGFAILHPKMKPRKTYLDEAADIDFLDLEGNGTSKEILRRAMIDCKNGTQTILTFATTDDEYHIVEKEMKYFYTPVVNGSFSLGLVLPNDRGCYMQISGIDVATGIQQLNPNDGFLIANWDFCTGMSKHLLNASDFSQRLIEEIRNNPEKCDDEMVQHLLWDIDRTWNITEHWKKSPDIGKVISAFLGTEGGLTRFHPTSALPTYVKIQNIFKSSYYKKAHYYSGWTFINEKQFTSNEPEVDEPVITAVRQIADGSNKSTSMYYNPAVVGVRLKETTISEFFSSTACKDKDLLTCYLLDDGGFIVSSNDDTHTSQIGKFLGKTEAQLMHKLTDIGVYKRRFEYEYHAVCTKYEERINSAIRMTNLMVSTATFIQSVLHVVMDTLLSNLIWTSRIEAASDVFIKMTNYSCTKQRALYYFMPNSEMTTSDNDIVCGNCSRKFSAIHMPKTNLLLVVIRQPNCPMFDCPVVPHLMHEPEETSEPDANRIANMTRYRRRPRHPCFASHPQEDASVCSSAIQLKFSVPHFGLLLSLFLLAWV